MGGQREREVMLERRKAKLTIKLIFFYIIADGTRWKIPLIKIIHQS
jgi:hypothetical protein